jgi:hypothetical protein
MIEPTTADWDRIRALCRRAGRPPERVDRMERVWSEEPSRCGFTLLAGLPKTVSLVLARWLGPVAAKALSEAEGSVLVIGPRPETIQPPIGRWPGLVRPELSPFHVVVVPTEGPLATPRRAAPRSAS